MNRINPLAVGLLGILFFSACNSQNFGKPIAVSAEEAISYGLSPIPSPSPMSGWQKRHWIQKVATLLRDGHGLSPSDDLEGLMALTPEQIIDKFMQSPRFGDTVMDFNMYFLGFKTDSIRNSSDQYTFNIYFYPAAIHSAVEVVRGGDFLKLLDLEQPLYVPPLDDPFDPAAPQPSPSASPAPPQDPNVLRLKLETAIQKDIDLVIDFVKNNPNASMKDVCVFASKHDSTKEAGVGVLGVSIDVSIGLSLSLDWYGKIQLACRTPSSSLPSDLIATLQNIRAKNQILFEQLPPLDSSKYSVKSLTDIKSMDYSAFQFADKWTVFRPLGVSNSLPNSSTNFDRKRAAYVLRRYFCDDLSAINVENPINHVQGKHASDPSCFSCHYKLDPMAGFFRDKGLLFTDFANSKSILFDDAASVDLQTYESAWKATPSSGRTWDVGYVRSVAYENQNSYGSTMDDLSDIIRQAPEVKSCIVRRMFEYFVAENQAVDAGYLKLLTDEFTHDSVANSSDAFKKTISKLLLSNTFLQIDPAGNQCYDYPPGTDPTLSPPCQVAATLQRNCVLCHGSTGGSGHLDLSQWIRLPDGTYNFPHLRGDGTQHSRSETFNDILMRLTSSDDSIRMPLGKYISSQDREDLYLWANQILNQKGLDQE